MLYVIYRTAAGKPVFKRVTVPARALTGREVEAEYGSILVPVLGTPLDDDIMQTAGRLAGEENEDFGEGGAVIEALWVFEVPMALPLDARDPRRASCARPARRSRAPRRWGRSTRASRSPRRPCARGAPARRSCARRGAAASRRSCSRPRSRPASAAACGSAARRACTTRSSGETTRYVLQKAHCRVILTAPPSDERAAHDPTRPVAVPPDRSIRWAIPSLRTARRRLARVPAAMFVLVVGAGRVGSSVATSALRAGHTVSVLDEDPLSHERLDVELGTSWEEAGGRFTIGTALEIDALIEAGIEEADVFIASTNGDNTNLVVAQLAQRRFEVAAGDRARARPAPRRPGTPSRGCRRSARRRSRSSSSSRRPSGPLMAGLYVIIAGAGKVGWNLARELLERGDEVTVIEQDRRRYLTVEQELEHAVQYGDATELWVLERAGIQRADLVVAVTGDDEDNLLICQVAKEKYLCERIIARCNNPRNLDALQAARDPAGGLGDRPDPAPDRARGAALRPRPPARPARGAARDHRARRRRGRAGGGQARRPT